MIVKRHLFSRRNKYFHLGRNIGFANLFRPFIRFQFETFRKKRKKRKQADLSPFSLAEVTIAADRAA